MLSMIFESLMVLGGFFALAIGVGQHDLSLAIGGGFWMLFWQTELHRSYEIKRRKIAEGADHDA